MECVNIDTKINSILTYITTDSYLVIQSKWNWRTLKYKHRPRHSQSRLHTFFFIDSLSSLPEPYVS